MNKNELSAAIAAKAGLTRKDAEAALCAMSDIIAESLKNGEKVQIVVRADDLQPAQIAQINEIVYAQTGIAPTGVTIIKK